MRKKLSVLALAAVMATTLAACGGNSATTASELQQVKDADVLRVGTEGTYSPFSFHDPKTNQLVGYDVEVIAAVAHELGVKVEYVETPWMRSSRD